MTQEIKLTVNGEQHMLAISPDATLLKVLRDDLGLLLSGSLWFGRDDVLQLSYSAYATNGLRPESNTMARFWDDNNADKQFGGRRSLSFNGERLSA